MALWLIGVGLYAPGSITLQALERARACDRLYCETYTATLGNISHEDLEAVLERPVTALDREGVEVGGKDLIAQAADEDIGLLVPGDPMSATTHTDFLVRGKAAGVPVHVVHGTSIFTAAPGLVGLQHYKFGKTTTLVRPEPNWLPTSPFDAVAENREAGLHTLVLLDIKAHEPGPDGKGYFMTGPEGLELLLRLAEEVGADWFTKDTQVAVVARAGSDAPHVGTGRLEDLVGLDWGAPLHCVVVPGPLQVVEQEAWDALAAQ